MKQWNKYLCWICILGMLISTGCSKGLEQWVRQKGYVYYPDFQESPLMGQILQGEQIIDNPCIVSRSNTVPLEEKTQVQVMKNSDKIQQLLHDVTQTAILGDFHQVKEAILTLRNLHAVRLNDFIPSGPCNDFRMNMVTEVLNAGGISILLKDANGNDITYLFKPVSEDAVPSDVVFGRPIFINNRHFHLGYKTELFACESVNRKDIVVSRNQTVNNADVALQLRYLDYQKQGYEHIALMRIMVSGFIPQDQMDISMIKSNQFLSTKDTEQTWKSAHKPINGRLELTQGGVMQLFEGARGGISARKRSTGIYFEVLSITEMAVRMRIQYIRYMDVK